MGQLAPILHSPIRQSIQTLVKILIATSVSRQALWIVTMEVYHTLESVSRPLHFPLFLTGKKEPISFYK